jgi:hypothetical protein
VIRIARTANNEMSERRAIYEISFTNRC